MDFKNIHIGTIIQAKIKQENIEQSRICKFFNFDVQDLEEMLSLKSMDCELLLKWSKLLEYDFFRIYSQHLILYSPPSSASLGIQKCTSSTSSVPKFRKNIYTREIINFILEQIDSGNLTKAQVIERYRIPKTTLYKWIDKYKN